VRRAHFIPLCLSLLLTTASVLAQTPVTPEVPQGSAPATAPGERVWDLKEVDHTPTRLTRTNPRYPARLLREGIEGVVYARFIVEADGSVSNFEIQKSSDARFDAATRECVLRWRFDPARVAGQAVRVRVLVPVQFKMEE